MLVEAANITGNALQQTPRNTDKIDQSRRDLEQGQSSQEPNSSSGEGGVQPEEILTQIKSLTEDGLYSVRFENNQEFDEMVVKIVDTQTDEVIRQVPAEEILGVKASLEDLRGQLVNTVR